MREKKEEPVYLMFDKKCQLYAAQLGHTTNADYGKTFTENEAKRFLKKHPGKYEKILKENNYEN